MMRSIVALAFATLLTVPGFATAQTGEALIQKLGASSPIPNPGFPADKKAVYKIAWDVTKGPEKPEDIAPGFSRPANFLFMADAEGLSRKKVHLAIIVRGAAAKSLRTNAAYKTAAGVDNASIPLLEALNAAGVQIIVCGQALIGLKVPREELLPFVKVATSATMARATLHAQGYVAFPE
ncbi:MAG: DsrE family protein [Gemmatimonadaceae bacterium]